MSELIEYRVGSAIILEAPPAEPASFVALEVPRWAGRLALKRHVLEGDELVLLLPDEASEDNLLGQVLAWRATLAPGELAERVDAVLDDAKDWLRASEMVTNIAAVLGLSNEHVDQLFAWAREQRV